MPARNEPTIVYVHGNGNKLAQGPLKEKWDEALAGRNLGEATRMAYWADLHYDSPIPLEETLAVDEVALEAYGTGQPEEADVFRAELVAEMEADFGALDPDMVSLMSRMVDEEEAASSKDAPEDSPLEVLPTKWLRTRALRRLTKDYAKDVYRYFFAGSADAMKARVREQLGGLDGPIVVVGHSLGSIVAYDVLNELPGGSKNVRLYLTLGSPLGIREVQDHLTQPLRVPPEVLSWTNLSDRMDVVALDNKLKDDYEPSDLVTDYSVDNWTNNNHSIQGYLDKPEALAAIEKAIGPLP